MKLGVLLGAVVAAAASSAGATACHDDLDCSLNGVCVGGSCVCDKPWSGEACHVMNFKPVRFPQGYGMTPNVTVWGGGVLHDVMDGRYHLYVCRMTRGCPLLYWTTNSRVDHAVADTITGPYIFKDVAVNTWSTNPAPVMLPDGSYAIFTLGPGAGSPDGGKNCPTQDAADGSSDELPTDAGSTIHVSDSLDGPWKPLEPNTLGPCNNPAPWVSTRHNGTIYALCDGVLKRASDISGPWTAMSNISYSGGVEGHYEDPFLYTCTRGHFHVLYHVYRTDENKTECRDSTVSGHVFSRDGLVWHSYPKQPYTTQVVMASGETITISTRERPKGFFNREVSWVWRWGCV